MGVLHFFGINSILSSKINFTIDPAQGWIRGVSYEATKGANNVEKKSLQKKECLKENMLNRPVYVVSKTFLSPLRREY